MLSYDLLALFMMRSRLGGDRSANVMKEDGTQKQEDLPGTESELQTVRDNPVGNALHIQQVGVAGMGALVWYQEAHPVFQPLLFDPLQLRVESWVFFQPVKKRLGALFCHPNQPSSLMIAGQPPDGQCSVRMAQNENNQSHQEHSMCGIGCNSAPLFGPPPRAHPEQPDRSSA